MLLMDCHHNDPQAPELLNGMMKMLLPPEIERAVFLCVGSDRHILDCLGPLTGSLLQEAIPALAVYGTLDKPLHAGNLMSELGAINQQHPESIHFAVDASAGAPSELGALRLRDEPLMPGKALLKRLPPLGHYSLTGVLSLKGRGRFKDPQVSSLNPVYQMARLIAQAVQSYYLADY
ncbi:MAG: spore protease YyaC [Syntrophomonadaceae bacterium]